MDTTSQPNVAQANAQLRSAARVAADRIDQALRRLGDTDAVAATMLTCASSELRVAIEVSNQAMERLAFGPLNDLTHRESIA